MRNSKVLWLNLVTTSIAGGVLLATIFMETVNKVTTLTSGVCLMKSSEVQTLCNKLKWQSINTILACVFHQFSKSSSSLLSNLSCNTFHSTQSNFSQLKKVIVP